MTAIKRPIRRIACVGEVMIELVTGKGDTATLGVAGDTYNTAVYLARKLRGHDIAVSYVTVLGTDAFSDRILSAVNEHGIDSSFIERRPDKLPGFYTIETDDEGERSFNYWRSDSAARTLFSDSSAFGLEILNKQDMVVLSGVTLAILSPEARMALIKFLATFSDSGGTVVFDSNYRPGLWDSAEVARKVTEDIWRVCDIALPSVDDEMALFNDVDESAVLQRFRSFGVQNGAMKRGSQGPLDLSGQAGPIDFVKAAKVVDSTAAGDSFNAGYLAEIVLGGTSGSAMLQGHSLASTVIGFQGAIMPEEVSVSGP